MTVRQPTEKVEAQRVGAGIRGIAAGDVRAAMTDGEAAQFGLTVRGLRLLPTEGLGDASVGFEATVTAV